MSPSMPYQQNSRLCLIYPAPSLAQKSCVIADPWQHTLLQHNAPPWLSSASSHLHPRIHLRVSCIPCNGNIMVHLSLCSFFPSFWFSVHQGGMDFLFICSSVLSITKPSTVLQWPQHWINPLSASQSSITPLSITSDPSSAHLSHTAHAQRWSPQRAPLASHTGRRGQRGRRKLEGNAETEDGREKKDYTLPSLPSPSPSLHAAESVCFMSLHAY